MRTLLLVVCVAILAAAAAAPLPAQPAASPELCSAAAGAVVAAAPGAAFAGVGMPALEPRIACMPTCPYYSSYCQELCTNLGGVKSFSCTPAPPGFCASWSCTCNRTL
jgi:hypothetical protein